MKIATDFGARVSIEIDLRGEAAYDLDNVWWCQVESDNAEQGLLGRDKFHINRQHGVAPVSVVLKEITNAVNTTMHMDKAFTAAIGTVARVHRTGRSWNTRAQFIVALGTCIPKDMERRVVSLSKAVVITIVRSCNW